MPAGLARATTFRLGNRVWIMGGLLNSTSAGTSNIYSTLIHADGSIDPWTLVGTLPAAVLIPAAAGTSKDGYAFIVGGAPANVFAQNTNKVWSMKLSADGSIGPVLVDETPFPLNLGEGDGPAAASNSFLYIQGAVGTDSNIIYPIWGANIGASGVLGLWQQVSNWVPGLPNNVGMEAGATVECNGYLVHLGGYYNTDAATSPRSDIYTSKINGDGSLGQMVSVGSLTVPRAQCGAVAFGDTIVVFGGTTTGNASNPITSVDVVRVLPGGGVSVQSHPSSLLVPVRSCPFQAQVVDGVLYLFGGRISTSSPAETLAIQTLRLKF